MTAQTAKGCLDSFGFRNSSPFVILEIITVVTNCPLDRSIHVYTKETRTRSSSDTVA